MRQFFLVLVVHFYSYAVSAYSTETEAYYQELVMKHRSGQILKLEDFNRTFYVVPQVTASQDNSLRCANQMSEGGCAPDTFYSWGPLEKMQNVKDNSPNGLLWKQPLNKRYSIFLNQSTMGSYCYGRHPLRFKFKSMPRKAGLNQRIMSDTFNEWILRSYGAYEEELNNLESVSFGQREHFDEIVTEIQKRMDPKERWHEAPLYVRSYDRGSLKLKLLNGCVPERLPMTEAVLVENLVLFLEVIFKNEGWIHFNNCTNCSSEHHFETKWPTFFNPQ